MTAKLSEMAIIQPGYLISKNRTQDDTGYAYSIYRNSIGELPEKAYYSHPIFDHFLTQRDDIVIKLSKDKDIALITDGEIGTLVSNRFLIIRCNSQVHPGYICNQLRSDLYARKSTLWRDAVLPNQKIERLRNLKINLPSLEEQATTYMISKQLEELSYKLQKEIDEYNTAKKLEEEEREIQHERYMQELYSCYRRSIQPSDDSTSDSDEVSD